MAASSWVSTFLRASRVAPTAKAMLVSSTRPSGTMATRPATEPCTASTTPTSAASCADTNKIAVGIINQLTILMTWLTPDRSSLLTSENRRASLASLKA